MLIHLQFSAFFMTIRTNEPHIIAKLLSRKVIFSQTERLTTTANSAFGIVKSYSPEMVAAAAFAGDFAFIVIHGECSPPSSYVFVYFEER